MYHRIIVTLAEPIVDPRRAEIATHFARIYNGNLDHRHEMPYMPNTDDTLFWTIDTSNDWKVKFFRPNEDFEPNQFEVIYRYSRKERVPEMLNWAIKLAETFNGSAEVVEFGVS